MSPSSFLNDPIRWMEEMSARRTTITGAPNFAYQLILTVLHFDKSARDIDLKDLRIIVNGAEPVSYTLVERFETALEQYGMRRHIVVPAYGMAEATDGLTIDSSMSGISISANPLRISRDKQEDLLQEIKRILSVASGMREV